MLSASEEDLIAALKDELRLEVPSLKTDDLYVGEHGDTRVDVSGDPYRLIRNREKPVYIPGTKIVVVVPFDGEADFFQVQPQSFTFSPPEGQVVGQELHLTYVRTDHKAEDVKRQYQQTVNELAQHLDSLRASAKTFNDQLPGQVRQEFSQRKAKLLADAGMVAALGIPIKRRQDAPTTYAIPIQRRRPRIERPVIHSGTFKPELALPAEEYEFILSTISNMVEVMERSPRAFENMEEENLRQHFLVQINGQYEGNATGETFNYQGKTDIFLRVEDRNVFIAECAFWKGEKNLKEKIDQLLSYLSWRDTKTALLVFNRNAKFSDVLAKIGAAAVAHPCFKRDLGKKSETFFRYVFHQPGDSNREVLLTIMAFDIPRPGTEP